MIAPSFGVVDLIKKLGVERRVHTAGRVLARQHAYALHFICSEQSHSCNAHNTVIPVEASIILLSWPPPFLKFENLLFDEHSDEARELRWMLQAVPAAIK